MSFARDRAHFYLLLIARYDCRSSSNGTSAVLLPRLRCPDFRDSDDEDADFDNFDDEEE
jgi:hypothetical protein